MSTVRDIEAAIEKLQPGEFLALIDRLLERHAEVWDRQIENDAQSGKLDALYAWLEKENRGQPDIPPDEILGDGKL